MRKRFIEKILCCAVAAFILFTVGNVHAADGMAARLISSRGQVEVILSSSSGWQKATPGIVLPQGAMVRTGEDGVASLLMADETLIKLNRNSRFLIKEVNNNAGWNKVRGIVSSSFARSKVRLEKGEAWFLNKNREADLEVETSTVTAAIRGTEFNVRMSPDATVEVAVLEGRILVGNEQGELNLGSGEVAVTRPGSAPVKRLLLQTADTVQWTIVIPALFSSRDLKLVSQDQEKLLAEKERFSAKIKDSTNPEDLAHFSLVLRDLGLLDEAEDVLGNHAGNNLDNIKVLAALAWIQLDRGDYTQAQENFIKSGSDDPETVAGLALALDGLDKRAEAEKLVGKADGTLSSLVKAWFELSSGRVNIASATLDDIMGNSSGQAVVWELSSLVYLAEGKKDEARNSVAKAVKLMPWSPTPLIISSYLDQADHDLTGAEISILKALKLESDNVTAILALARIKFGQGYIDEADQLLDKAIDLAPENGEVLNLQGFTKLAGRDDRAGDLFVKASKADPAMAEPHLGAALVMMREGDEAGALEEMSKAVLLDPRRAILRSYWAKILYQMERYQKALDVLDIARNIDPNDPTPELYRALALKDLNRPGEAIASLQRAIKLNDNRAVYRSRFLLDQDLAVKNVNLAYLFYDLEMIDWATAVAVDSVKSDYTNSAAHLFYSGALDIDPERTVAQATENLLARLLQPANINSFNSFNEYTSFLERPSIDGSLQLQTGNWHTSTQKFDLTGAAPAVNFAGQLQVYNHDTDGWHGSNYWERRHLLGYLKWGLAMGHNLLLSVQTSEDDLGDVYLGNDYEAPSEPRDIREFQEDKQEVGYHFSSDLGQDLLLHFRHVERVDDNDIYSLESLGVNALMEQSFDQIQGQYIVKKGCQQILIGGLSYSGNSRLDFDYIPPAPIHDYSIKQKAQTFFVHDIYKVNSNLYFEGALYADKMETGSVETGISWDLSEYSPRLGVAWEIVEDSTVRLAGFRYLRPFNSTERLEPVDIAGIPVYRNGLEGAITEEVNLVLENRWEKAFASISAFYTDMQLQQKLAVDDPLTEEQEIFKGVSFKANLMPFEGVGIAFKYLFKDLLENDVSEIDQRYDHLVTLKGSWVCSNGFSAGMVQTSRRLYYYTVDEVDQVNITDLWMSYRLPSRKALVKVEANNIFDADFNWVSDVYLSDLQARSPGQELLVTVDLFF